MNRILKTLVVLLLCTGSTIYAQTSDLTSDPRRPDGSRTNRLKTISVAQMPTAHGL